MASVAIAAVCAVPGLAQTITPTIWSGGVYPTRSGKALDRPINEASADIAKALRRKIGPDLFESTVSGMHNVRKALD